MVYVSADQAGAGASLQLGAGSCQSPALDHAGRREQSLTPLISEGAFHEGQKTEERNSASFVTSAAKPPLFSALFILFYFWHVTTFAAVGKSRMLKKSMPPSRPGAR